MKKYHAMVVSIFVSAGVIVIVMFAALHQQPTNQTNELSQMLIVDICPTYCGLGNQMFRYAAGLGLALQNPTYTACVFGMDSVSHLAHRDSAFIFDVFPCWKRLEPCPASVSRLALPSFQYQIDYSPQKMDHFETAHSIFREFPFKNSTRPVLVDGCMQSFKYFQNIPHPFFKLRQQHAARQWLADRNVTSVVHIRRGDKMFDGSTLVPLAYYKKAMRMLNSRVAVCTDDPAWVRQQSMFQDAVISLNNPGFDMALIAAATDSVIIGIGTFGWWGAYLSKAKRKYFYPVQYVGELAAGYKESDYIPFGVKGQGEWIPLMQDDAEI